MDAEWELEFIFTQKTINVHPDPPTKLSCGPHVTNCVIKPHALREGKAGRIIEEIQARGFHVFGIQAFILTKKESEDFYEIYKGIEARDYFGLVRQGNIFLCSYILRRSQNLKTNCKILSSGIQNKILFMYLHRLWAKNGQFQKRNDIF